MAFPNPVKYEEDLTGVSPDNFVANEIHIHERKGDDIIIPRGGPFFAESIIIRDKVTNEILKENIDYKFGMYFQKASLKASRPIYVCIQLLNRERESGVALDYQVIGGQYSEDIVGLYSLFHQLLEKNSSILWDEIIKPDTFPPGAHRHHSDDIYGMEPIVIALEGIIEQLRLQNNTVVDKVAEEVIEILMNGFLKNIPIENVDGLREILDMLTAKDYNFEQRLSNINEQLEALRAKDLDLKRLIDLNKEAIESLNVSFDSLILRVAQSEEDIAWIKAKLINHQEQMNTIVLNHNRLLDRVDSLRQDVNTNTQEITATNQRHDALKDEYGKFKASTNSTLGEHAGKLETHASQIDDILRVMSGYVFYKLGIDHAQSGVLAPDTVWAAESNVRRNRTFPSSGLRGGEIIVIKDITGQANTNRIELTGLIDGFPDGCCIDRPFGFCMFTYSQSKRKWVLTMGR